MGKNGVGLSVFAALGATLGTALVAATIASCATVESYVENADTDYRKTPIEIRQTPFERTLSLGDYSLSQDKRLSGKKDLPKTGIADLFETDSDSTITGGRYAFAKNGEKLLDVYIYEISNMKQKGSVSTGTVNDYIDIVRGPKDVEEYELEKRLGSDVILAVTSAGATIEISDYAVSTNKTANKLKVITGLRLTVNGKERGIVTFYKTPALYEPNASIPDDGALRDTVFLFALAAYESRTQRSNTR